MTEVSSTSSTELQAFPSSTILDTSILATTSISTSISTVNAVSIFLASLAISTIVSIPTSQATSARTVETKPQLSTKFLGKGKGKEDDVDRDEEL